LIQQKCAAARMRNAHDLLAMYPEVKEVIVFGSFAEGP
jgi:predicted nucleotidyltransferase